MTIEKKMFPIRLRTRYTSGLVEGVQSWLKTETDVEYPRELIESAILEWVEQQNDRLIESLPEVLTSPHLKGAQEFRRVLEERYQTSGALSSGVVQEAQLSPVFTGGREFSKEKLAAMIAYIAAKGHEIYRTNLNKLLFYSDMTAYYLWGQGISGASYLNMPYGPVPENVDMVTDELAGSGLISRIDMPEFGPAAQRIVAGSHEASSSSSELTQEELATIDWVLETYGDMSSSEISEYSHLEKAYKFTRPREPIAYEYAKFFQKLPKKDN
jgi:hypothetical protein